MSKDTTMSTSSSAIDKPSLVMPGATYPYIPTTAGQKRKYSAYLVKAGLPGHHNTTMVRSKQPLPIGLRTDHKTYLPYSNEVDSEHVRKIQETPELHLRAAAADKILGSDFCVTLDYLRAIRFMNSPKQKSRPPAPRKSRVCKSTKDKAEEIGQRVEAFKARFDARKVAPVVATKKSSTSTVKTSTTPIGSTHLTPSITTHLAPSSTTSCTPTEAQSSTASTTAASVSQQVVSQQAVPQNPTDAIPTPAPVDPEHEQSTKAASIAVEEDDESGSEITVDDDIAISFIGEPIVHDPVDIVEKDVINFKDSGIFMELPESFDANDGEALEQQSCPVMELPDSFDTNDGEALTQQLPVMELPESFDSNDGEALAQQYLASESNEHVSSVSDGDRNAILDNAVTSIPVDSVSTAGATPDAFINTQEAIQSSLVGHTECTSSNITTVEPVEDFFATVTKLEFYQGSLDEIRARLLDIMKQHDYEEPTDDERPIKRVAQWVEKYMEGITNGFLPFAHDRDEAGGLTMVWFDQSAWSKPESCNNLLRAILLLESMLVSSFEEAIHTEDEQKVTPKIATIKRYSPVEDLRLEMYPPEKTPNLIMQRATMIWDTEDSNETRNYLLENCEFNIDDISKLLILAEHAPGVDPEVMETLRIVLRRIRGMLLYKGAESEVRIPGWPEVARKIPETIYSATTYELLNDLQVHNFVPDIQNRFHFMAQLGGQSPSDVHILQCLPLVRKTLNDMQLSEDECRSKLQQFFHVDFPILGSPNIDDVIKEGLHDYAKLARLLGYVTWLDALLDPFRNKILAEDTKMLVPRMQQIYKERDSIITLDLESQYQKTRLANPQARTPVIETLEKADRDFRDKINKTLNSNRWRSNLTESIGLGPNHQYGLNKLLNWIQMTANPCEDIGLVEEIRDTLRSICKTLIFEDTGISPSEEASRSLRIHDISSYQRELAQNPEIGSWDDFVAQLDSSSVYIEKAGKSRELQPDVTILEIFGETSLKIQASYNDQGVLTPARYEHVHVDPKKSTFGFWNFDERKFLDWINIHMNHLEGITAITMETPRGGHNEETLRKQVYHRDRTLEHIELTRKRVQFYLKNRQSSTAINGILSTLDNRKSMMNKIQPYVIQESYLSSMPCPMVNTPEGCKARETNECWHRHDNEGKRCKDGDSCKFYKKKKCVYLHLTDDEKSAEKATGGSSKVIPGNTNRPCPYVNKPGSCSGEKNGTCLFSHMNKNQLCKSVASGKTCKFGDACAYRHQQIPASGYSPASGSSTPATSVLRGPKPRAACSFVNTPSGCSKGDSCVFDHSLEGVPCPDQNCSGTGCVYLHSSGSRTRINPINKAGGSGQTQSTAAPQQGQPLPKPRTQGSGFPQATNTPDGQRKVTMKERIQAELAKAQLQRQKPSQGLPTGPRNMQQQTGSMDWQPATPRPQQDTKSSNSAHPFSETSSAGSSGFRGGNQSTTPQNRNGNPFFGQGIVAPQKNRGNSQPFGTRNNTLQQSRKANPFLGQGIVAPQQNRGSNQSFGARNNAPQQGSTGIRVLGQANATSKQNRGNNQPFGQRNNVPQQSRNGNQFQGSRGKRPRDDDVDMTDDDFHPKRFGS